MSAKGTRSRCALRLGVTRPVDPSQGGGVQYGATRVGGSPWVPGRSGEAGERDRSCSRRGARDLAVKGQTLATGADTFALVQAQRAWAQISARVPTLGLETTTAPDPSSTPYSALMRIGCGSGADQVRTQGALWLR